MMCEYVMTHTKMFNVRTIIYNNTKQNKISRHGKHINLKLI